MTRYIVGCELLSEEDRATLRMLTGTKRSDDYDHEAAVITEYDDGTYSVMWWYIPNEDRDYHDDTVAWLKSNRNNHINRITARKWLQENINDQTAERSVD